MNICDLSFKSSGFPTKISKTIAAIAILCLIFTNAALSATGTVDLTTRYQTLDGFGGAFCWSGMTLVNLANNNPAIYDVIFRDLGLDILRLRNTYDYDAGYIDRSAETIIEGRARTGRPLKVMLSSWSPPAYLKSNSSTIRGTLATDFNDPNNGALGYVYQRYAQWWYNSIIDFTNHGVVPDFVDMQNEPDWVTDWDTCRFEPQENATNAGYSQAFRAFYNKINTLPNRPIIFAPEGAGMTNTRGYIDAFNTTDKSNIYAYSHHLYNWPDGGTVDNPDGYIPVMTDFAADYSDKPRIQTEFSRGEANALVYGDLMSLAKLIHNSLYYGGETGYLYWELTYGAPKGLVSITDTTWTINPPYYAMKHYSAFTDPNWQRVEAETNSPDLRMTAFISPDNTQLSAVIINTSLSSIDLGLSLTGFTISDGNVFQTTASRNCELTDTYNGGILTLEPNSITTLALTIAVGPQYTLSVSSTSGGSVITPGEGNFNCAQDSNAVIVAQADPSYHFNVWTGSAVTAGKVADPCSASTTVFMDANYTVIANFEVNPFDSNAPLPNPMTWDILPHATGATTISMTAAIATDDNPPVYYYFECINDDGKSSDWQTDTAYTAGNLEPNTLYSFKVMARDSYLTPNETAWSSTESATTNDDIDINAPEPNPMTWTIIPTAADCNSIFMMAGPANDISGVEFYFDCLTEGGHDSGWQDSNTYQDTGLARNTQYTYKVKARDKSRGQNETEWSTSLSARTNFKVLRRFTGTVSDGCEPWGGLAVSGSTLYGMTRRGGTGGQNGILFKMNTDGTGFQIMRNFSGGSTNGWGPTGSLIFSGSTIYGMTLGGGSTGLGVVFKVNTDNTNFQVIHTFAAGTGDGHYPQGSLLLSGSTLYGMTCEGGTYNRGTLFKVNTDSSGYQILHSFAGNATDGGWPFGTPILVGSALYGTTPYGGTNGVGTIFKVNTDSSNYSVIYNFTGGADGGWGFDPAALDGLIYYNNKLYGMTTIGGIYGMGNIFKVNTNGSSFENVHSFTNSINDGSFPASLSLTNSGSILYGTAQGGGTYGTGAIFQIDANGSGLQVLHSFTGTDGLFPQSFVIKSGSKLYGMSRFGGINTVPFDAMGSGTIFEVSLPFANCGEAIADNYRLDADLNSDCYVNSKDLDIFADNWLNTNCGSLNNCQGADFVPVDGTVNFQDFGNLAEQWMQCNNPADINCPLNW